MGVQVEPVVPKTALFTLTVQGLYEMAYGAAYGQDITVVPSGDLERYLRWGSDMRRRMKERGKW